MTDAVFSRVPVVTFERQLSAPITTVWSVLTEPKMLPAWFGEGVIEQKEGGRVHLMGGHIRGIVTQYEPQRKLAYTWNVFNPDQNENDYSPYPESYVAFELAESGEDVLLKLTHLPVLERFEKQNAMGWHTFLDMVAVVVTGGTLEQRDIYMSRNAQRYGVDLTSLVK